MMMRQYRGLKKNLVSELEIKDTENLKYFLGIEVATETWYLSFPVEICS
jgi:hypothetical protein